MYALHNPFQYPDVVSKSWPKVFSIFIFSKPIHGKDSRCVGQVSSKLQPMINIVTNMVSHEWQHCKWISSHFANFSNCSGCCFRSHSGGQVHTEIPIE